MFAPLWAMEARRRTIVNTDAQVPPPPSAHRYLPSYAASLHYIDVPPTVFALGQLRGRPENVKNSIERNNTVAVLSLVSSEFLTANYQATFTGSGQQGK